MILLGTHMHIFKSIKMFNAFKIYKAKVENQLSKSIKFLRSDKGGAYFSTKFDAFCEEHDIIYECSTPLTQ